jgi:predicted transcriptional regulator
MKLKQLMALAAIVTPSLSFAATLDMGPPQCTYGVTEDHGIQLSTTSSDIKGRLARS